MFMVYEPPTWELGVEYLALGFDLAQALPVGGTWGVNQWMIPLTVSLVK